MDDLYHLLSRCEAHQNLFAHSTFPDPVYKCLRDLEVNVCFQKGRADLAKCQVDFFLSELPAVTKVLEDALKPRRKVLKHQSPPSLPLIASSPPRSVPVPVSMPVSASMEIAAF